MSCPWLLVLIRLLEAGPPKDTQVTTRAYEVRDLVWVSGPTAIAFDLCPARPSAGLDDRPGVAAAEPPIDLERMRETLQEIAVRRWPEDVVRITAAEPRLFVTAPEHLQNEVAQLLTLMRDACGTNERLQVRVLVGDGLLDLPMLLDSAEADRRVADLVATKQARVVRTAATTLRDGLAVTLRALDTRLCTRDYDVEIAGNSVVFDPVIDTATYGLEATVRAVRARGGTHLDLAMRHAMADLWRDRVLEPLTWCANLNGSSVSTSPPAAITALKPAMRERMPIRLDLPLDRFSSWAGSLVLPDGKVLYVPCQVTAHTGVAAAVFEVRVDGAHRALRTSMPRAATDPFELAILQTGALGAPGFDLARVSSAAFVNAMPTEDATASPFWPSFVRAAPLDARPLTNDLIAAESPDDAEAYHSDLSPFHLVLRAPAETCERVAGKIASQLDALRTFEVSGRVTSGARELARFRVPVAAGRITTIWSGLAGSFLFDWDVDVANNAAVANPQIGWLLDGLALQLMVQPLTAPRLQVCVNGKLHFLCGPPVLTSLESPFSPACEKIKTQALFLDETMLASASDASGGVRFGDDHLALEIWVAESVAR